MARWRSRDTNQTPSYWALRQSMADSTRILPAHIEETIQAIAKLHEEHHAEATSIQRALDQITRFIGRPQFIVGLTIVIALWIAGNLAASGLGLKPLDEPPFEIVNILAGILGLYVAIIILATQQRADELSGYRDQLTLELSILSEQKTAKIIELLEELRRDAPNIRNRYDPEAMEMAKPTDPQTVFNAIKDADGAENSDILDELAPEKVGA